MYCRSRVLQLTKIVQFSNKINLFGSNMTQGEAVDYKADLKKRLSPIQYHVTQEKGTERYILLNKFSYKFSKLNILF